ncbi:DUF3565 domain-containing protein [Stenotrophomonas sp. W1S232]|jgi:Protein of unknown function (DUF3565).|uniref:DUF3565 domain-containing protein n=1 Tax=Stenotrophomonas koreensis TaxID=266128 RepID=A0A7W3YWN8_9GAMM|nr:DUF3565 domain-containing protein [Stenotrophomonas koreensis]MBB1118174.1 DUF3565 domain-containing protein [Stenotrophomonas koreensis]
MQQPIVGFHLDAAQDWVAELACGHDQHVRHAPPWIERPWTQTAAGRQWALGQCLECRKCDRQCPPDRARST